MEQQHAAHVTPTLAAPSPAATAVPASTSYLAPALVIPAYNPSSELVDLTRELLRSWAGPIVVVNDGSDAPTAASIFAQLTQMGITVVAHAANLGKGRALKTGINQVLLTWPHVMGCVTADADGQHTVADILACADALAQNPESLIVCAWDFADGSVKRPLRSRIGERISKSPLKVLLSADVATLQTGLYAIPQSRLSRALTLTGERFEYETNLLLSAHANGVPLVELPIIQPRPDEGVAPHFNTLADTLRIMASIVKFAITSLTATVIDFMLFFMLSASLERAGLGVAAVVVATVLARMVSATVSFLLNRKMVFKSSKPLESEVIRYVVLVLAIMSASATLVAIISALTSIEPVVIKAPVDLALFFVNYQAQRRWVFRDRTY